MPFRNEDEALRARLDAVLDENAALKEELARREAAPKPAKPEPKPAREPATRPDPDRAPRAATERDPQARARVVVILALLTFVSMPGIVYTVLAFTSGKFLGPAIVMDGVALLAWGGTVYARYRITKETR
ncbi:MAG: hypothetical protein IPK71_03000 [Myxococcales bacterium]|nr:hypothetical protein [Myxococcales bacterium]